MGNFSDREDVEAAAMEAQIEPKPAPRSGLMPLTACDIEAVKGLSAAQQALNARWRAVELEVLEEAPPGARVTNWDLDQGVASWEIREAKP